MDVFDGPSLTHGNDSAMHSYYECPYTDMVSNSRYGSVGAVTLILGGIIFGFAVIFQNVGSDPTMLIQVGGIIGLVLIAVGLLGLLSLQFEVYKEESI